jgi:threonine/homoserine/homoserine lactone efflux protein
VLAALVSGGRGVGLGAAWAHAFGVGLYAALTVFGISALLVHLPQLFVLIQVSGALYLLWMAARLLRSSDASAAAQAEDGRSGRRAARDAFAVAFLNPKLAVFMLALFSQFVSPNAHATESLLLVTTAFAIDGLWYSLVVMLLSRGPWIEALRRNAARIDRAFGVLLGLLALSILASMLVKVLAP